MDGPEGLKGQNCATELTSTLNAETRLVPSNLGAQRLVQRLMRFRECVSVVAERVGTWALLTARERAVT